MSRPVATRPHSADPPPPPHVRLRDLARRLERLSIAGRLDPERLLIEKSTLVQQLRRLAKELETAHAA